MAIDKYIKGSKAASYKIVAALIAVPKVSIVKVTPDNYPVLLFLKFNLI